MKISGTQENSSPTLLYCWANDYNWVSKIDWFLCQSQLCMRSLNFCPKVTGSVSLPPLVISFIILSLTLLSKQQR